jgi:hypothetical protein
VKTPVIYTLQRGDETVFYVGRTINWKQRLSAHRARHGRDIKLNIVQDTFNGETPADAELKWIRHFQRPGFRLLNIVTTSGRSGRRFLGCLLPKRRYRSLKRMTREQHTTIQVLLAEASNLLFEKYGKKPIAK